MRSLYTLILVTTLSFAAHGQRPAVAAVRASDNPARTRELVPSSHVSIDAPRRRGSDIPLRALAGTGGGLVGAIAGLYVGASAIPHRPCGCDDPGLAEAVLGATFGTLVGAAVSASAPRLHSECSTARRIGLGLLGSLGGSVIGAVVGSNVPALGGPVVLFIGGAGAGAGLASGLC